METHRVEFLFQKYVQQQCSAAEKAELLEYLENGDADASDMLNRYMADRTEEFELPDEAEAGILEAIFQADSSAAKPKGVHKKRRIAPLWLAAAVALPVLAVSVWLVQHNNQPANKKTASVVKPGSDKAVLVLANGQEIELGGTEVINIADSGNAAIRLEKGILTYVNSVASGPLQYHTLTTPRGGKFQLVLPDGTHVWLNAASTIRFPRAFNGTERKVELKGEAFFDVAAQKNSVFSVDAANVKVKVLGTGFNVMAYEEEGPVKTTLQQGSVQVQAAAATVKLKPGEQAMPVAAGSSFAVQQADLDVVLAWKEDKFRFKNADIHTIMRQVARWYDVEVDYEGKVSMSAFSGAMKRNANVQDLLDILQETGYLHFQLEGNHIKVMNGPVE